MTRRSNTIIVHLACPPYVRGIHMFKIPGHQEQRAMLFACDGSSLSKLTMDLGRNFSSGNMRIVSLPAVPFIASISYICRYNNGRHYDNFFLTYDDYLKYLIFSESLSYFKCLNVNLQFMAKKGVQMQTSKNHTHLKIPLIKICPFIMQSVMTGLWTTVGPWNNPDHGNLDPNGNSCRLKHDVKWQLDSWSLGRTQCYYHDCNLSNYRKCFKRFVYINGPDLGKRFVKSVGGV